MLSRPWMWALYLSHAILASAAVHGQEDTPDSEKSKGVIPSFPLDLPPNPMPAPGFSGRNKSPDSALRKRAAAAAATERCGADFQSCDDSYCCSPSGYCGTAKFYCQAPDCQINYSNGCDALKTPGGDTTAGVARDQIGEVPYAYNPIYRCIVPNMVALTYDDGPNIYTSDLLDILDSYGAKATFFVTGINSNKGPIDDPNLPWKNLIQRMFEGNHQIASHTWGHQDLESLSAEQRRDQMIMNEMALRNIFGGFPTYMRPPYSKCSDESGCVQSMNDLGYHITYFDVDTDDYNNAPPGLIQRSKDIFNNAMNAAEPSRRPLLVIAHDVHQQTVYSLTPYMLERLYAAGYRAVTLGECLGDSPENWYRWAHPFSIPGRWWSNTSRRTNPSNETAFIR
ncbi:hypothetical protein ACO22_06019 [Paracoccidioides brasiliensis]|uniref:Chitin deacetylase n=1 Tax=Paracoccidioides brasiliensis TaxID=121759 RepID=A0A1D2J8U4_PARBR|nr:hypothetical protein ACO22_06019 [Paracoccidioides brasiliensis]